MNKDNPNRRHYLEWWLLTLLLAGALVGAFNSIVDPQARVLLVDKPGFNQIKIALPRNSRKGKANALRQCDYDTLILGTSRAETAVPMDHPALNDSNIYNAGLRAGTMYEMQRIAEYAIRHQDLKTVLLSLDYESFNARILYAEDFADSPLADTTPPLSLARYLFSLQTFWQSVVTVQWNIQGKAVMCADRGEHRRTYELEAARIAFDFILSRYATGHYGQYLPGDEHIRHLATLLRDLIDANVKVYAFISPVHVTHLELMTEMGLLDSYENWKRSLVQVFVEANRNLPEQKQAVLWDFSGYDEITTEKVPSPEGKKFMRWYTDSSHFSNEVGNLMLDRMFGLQTAQPLTAEPFGLPLTSDNVEVVIETGRRDSERYRRENPDEITRMQDMLRSAP